MSRKAKNTTDVLPKPIKPLKRVTFHDVVSVIRKSRDSGNGGRVVGLPRGELLPPGVSVADWVVKGRC